MNEEKIDLMVDIETLGTEPGCAILSIAAVPFNLQYDVEPFYARVHKGSCIEKGFFVDDDTVAWWNKQSIAAQEEAFSGQTNIEDALEDLSAYIETLGKSVNMWGNGASFDVPILEAAYKFCCQKPRWAYYNSMCYRTLKKLYPQVPYLPPRIKHNALHDARAQADHAQRIFKWMARGN
jgi:hypothetical protein